MSNKVNIVFCKTRKEEIKESIKLLEQFSAQLLIYARGGYLPGKRDKNNWKAIKECEYKRGICNFNFFPAFVLLFIVITSVSLGLTASYSIGKVVPLFLATIVVTSIICVIVEIFGDDFSIARIKGDRIQASNKHIIYVKEKLDKQIECLDQLREQVSMSNFIQDNLQDDDSLQIFVHREDTRVKICRDQFHKKINDAVTMEMPLSNDKKFDLGSENSKEFSKKSFKEDEIDFSWLDGMAKSICIEINETSKMLPQELSKEFFNEDYIEDKGEYESRVVDMS